MVTRYRSLVSYDGTRYAGFQKQSDKYLTIQGELERALAVVAKSAVPIVGAGRTDSGVHATGQVIAFDLVWRHDPMALQRALNVNLPADIVVRQLAKVPAQFHPRYSARRRKYQYRIYNQPIPDPLKRLYSWYVPQPLDVAKMNMAAQVLVGQHDFATFGQPPQGINTIRQLYRAEWVVDKEMCLFFIEANAFLYRMVRSIVGSLKLVGDGRWEVAQFVAAFQAKERRLAGTTAPACGLCLTDVVYDG